MNIHDLLRVSKALAIGHFVYKDRGKHGPGYIDKDKFPTIGSQNLVTILQAVAEKALLDGLDLGNHKEVALITPAYGAIKLGLPLAARLEGIFPETKIIQVETEVIIENGSRRHIIPENQKRVIAKMPKIIMEDIVNNGKTIREVNSLCLKEFSNSLIAALCIVDRGGQSRESLGVEGYYPYMEINMEQFDLREGACPLCIAGIPINTDLGKGAEWVEIFGQPPYPKDMDFSKIWS